ncbi:hypothetical protein ABBQ32_010044 [Trebouxia sp. C0010 RCD-2024]
MQEALSVGVTSRPHVCAGSVRANTAALQRCWRREPSRRAAAQICKERLLQCSAQAQSSDYITANVEVEPEAETEGMSAWLDGLKWDAGGLVAVMAQHVDTGEVLMQAYADRAALNETLQTRLATFYSRSRKGRWCKGETSGHFIKVLKVYLDCDRDSIIYQGEPVGPACHTGARTCYFSSVERTDARLHEESNHASTSNMPASSLFALEGIIQQRVQQHSQDAGSKPSWTAKLAGNQGLLCSKIREEAGELCETLEGKEGQERAACEMADLLYHSMVLLHVQDVPIERVLKELRRRFGTSGIDEKAARQR